MCTHVCTSVCVCVCVHTGTPEDPLADRWRMSEDPLAARWRMSEDSDSRHLADVTVKKEDSYYYNDCVGTCLGLKSKFLILNKVSNKF